MKKFALIVIVTVTAVACAKRDDQDLSKMKVEISERPPTREEIKTAEEIHVQTVPSPTPSVSQDKRSTIPGVSEILDVAQSYGSTLGPKVAAFTRIGKALWSLVEGNQASVTLKDNRVSLLPCYIDKVSGKCINADWSKMVGFKSPRVRGYKVVVKNMLGDEVVHYEYAISYDYGGSLDGHGQYLMNLTAIHSKLYVMWGFNFDAEFVVHEPTNIATKATDPVPAITGEVKWKVKNLLTNIRKSNEFWVSGSGQYIDLNQGDQEDVSKRK